MHENVYIGILVYIALIFDQRSFSNRRGLEMAILKAEQIKALWQSVKELESRGRPDRPVEVTSYHYEEHNYTFKCLNINGLKHLLRTGQAVFEFSDPTILDSSTDLIAGIVAVSYQDFLC